MVIGALKPVQRPAGSDLNPSGPAAGASDSPHWVLAEKRIIILRPPDIHVQDGSWRP